MTRGYYTVLGSLPHLPYFEEAERLPLTRLRLEQRIDMLPDDESRQIWEAEALVSLRHAVSRRPDDDAWLRRWRRAMPLIRQPVLREYVQFRLDQQVALAALRLRHAGLGPEAEPEIWAISPYGRHIRTHWQAPDFRLAARHPWLPAVREALEREDAVALERHLLESCWRRLDRLAAADPLGFAPVVAFVFQWDIVNAWLSQDPRPAAACFERLLRESRHAP